jgi:hypothetical protein
MAVGSLGFVEKVKPLILSRRETEIVESADDKVVRSAGGGDSLRTKNKPEKRP